MKTSLLMLPGLLNDERVWRAQAAELTPMFDIVAHNYSALDSMSLLADEALSAVKGDFHLVGFSMGGYVAFEILRKAPERVLSVAWVASSAQADSDVQKITRQKIIKAVGKGRFDSVLSATLDVSLYQDAESYAQCRLLLEDMAANYGEQRFCAHMTAIMNREDSRPLLSTLAMPIAVFAGCDDKVVSSTCGGEIAAAVQAVIEYFPSCGHMLPLEYPEQLSELLSSFYKSI